MRSTHLVLRCVAIRLTNGDGMRKWCCSVLRRVVVCCSVLQCVAVCCSVLQGVACVNYVFLAIRRTKEDAMRKVVLQCVAVCCSVLQCFACVIHVFLAIRRTKGDAMRKVVLQCVAVCCSVLQCVAVLCLCHSCISRHQTHQRGRDAESGVVGRFETCHHLH